MKENNKTGTTLIELLAFIFLFSCGSVGITFFGEQFGILGYILGFPVGILIPISVIWLISKVYDFIFFYILPFDRKSLNQTQKYLKNGSLHLFHIRLKHEGLKYLIQQKKIDVNKIQKLTLSGDKISRKGLDALKHFQNCKWLVLHGPRISDFIFENIQDLSQLEHLELRWTNVTGEGMNQLGSLRDLTEIDLWASKNLNPEGCRQLNELTQTKNLNLAFTAVGNNGFSELSDLLNVLELDLSMCKLTDAGLQNISNYPKLEKLELFRNKITDKGLEKLKHLRKLKTLKLRETMINGSCFEILTEFPNLEYLNLRQTDVTDNALQFIGQYPSLKTLNLKHTKITTEGLKHLTSLKLQALHLPRQIDDRAVKYLKEMNSLQLLSIKRCPFTKKDVEELEDLPNLKELRM